MIIFAFFIFEWCLKVMFVFMFMFVLMSMFACIVLMFVFVFMVFIFERFSFLVAHIKFTHSLYWKLIGRREFLFTLTSELRVRIVLERVFIKKKTHQAEVVCLSAPFSKNFTNWRNVYLTTFNLKSAPFTKGLVKENKYIFFYKNTFTLHVHKIN